MAGIKEVYAQEVTVAGAYSDPGSAFVIRFPDGWSGSVVDGKYVVVDSAEDSASMTVFTMSRLDARDLISAEEDHFADSLSSRSDAGCDNLGNSLVDVGGVVAFRSVSECPDPGNYSKTDTYVILTLTKSIVISYSATTSDAYDRHLSDFESSLQMARISEPVSFRSLMEVVLGTTNVFVRSIDVGGNVTSVAVATSSSAPAIAFDEEEKELTITVNEQRRNEGGLLVPVDDFLLGPYQVHVDGEPSEDFLVIDDEANAAQLIYVGYGSGPHEIVISAAEVIPEFDTVAAGILAAVISGIVLYHRLGRRLFDSASNPGSL